MTQIPAEVLNFCKAPISHSAFSLSSGISSLDLLLASQLQPGKIIEWGIPPGRFGRLFPALFLRQIQGQALWIKDEEEPQFYPQAFHSLGVPLSQVFFIHCDQPLKRLRPVFLDNSFQVIVIDTRQKMGAGEFAFLTAAARKTASLYFVLRPFFLSAKSGNPFSSLRLNCSFESGRDQFHFQFIKGAQQQGFDIALKDVFQEL